MTREEAERFVADFYAVDAETARRFFADEIESYRNLSEASEHTEKYELADVRFNNGRGALLCNECKTIIAEGWEHADRVHLCQTCLLNTERKAVKTMIDILDERDT